MSTYRKLRHRLYCSPLRLPLIRWRHRGLTPADTFLASYPRSGNTWLRSLLFELLSGDTPTFADIDDRESVVGHVGDQAAVPKVLPAGGRLLKTHEAFRGEYLRAIYLARDPRDVVRSEYRFQRWREIWNRELDNFAKAFVDGTVSGYGGWGDHVLSWLGAQDGGRGAVHVVRYEDLRKDPVKAFGAIVRFLGLDASPEAVALAVENNSLRRMRARENAENDGSFKDIDKRFRFVNRGSTGGWREDPSMESLAGPIAARFEQAMVRLGYPLDATPETDGESASDRAAT